jgi:stearoyl-CoA 9-desaturase NADPH oxidoreductase
MASIDHCPKYRLGVETLGKLSKHVFTVTHGHPMNTPLAKPHHRPSQLRKLLRHPLWAPFNQRETWDRLTTSINPLWSLLEVRARIVRVEDEALDVKSIWLKPNARFKGFHAGQHVLLELEIKGARHARCFSFSTAPRADGLIRLTIKRKEDGPVSHAAHALAVGQMVRLSQAQGDFTPRGSDNKLLLLSAGSGVTPMMALLQSFADAKSIIDVTLLHCGHNDAEMIFAKELQALAAQLPNLTLHLHATEHHGRLDAKQIAGRVPDWKMRETLLCGPDGFMQTIEAMYADAGRNEYLQSESFGRRAAQIDPNASEHRISTTSNAQVFTVKAGHSLLDGAEAAGLQPKFGCRRGICRTCQCKKLSGTVTNLLTGQVSGPGEELIQLCISSPQSALELAL